MKTTKQPKMEPSFSEDRILDGAVGSIESPDYSGVFYQHTVLCQTNLPYRDPGDVEVWKRKNGRVNMLLKAGYAWHPNRKDFMPYGLPFGPKARLNLMHLNQRAIQTGSRIIETEGSLYQFTTHVLKMDGCGRNMAAIQEQLIRLSTTFVLLGVTDGGSGVTLNSPVVDSFRTLPFQKKDSSIMWPTSVRLSEDYYSSVVHHAVPIDEAHMRALSHTALGLDVYTWLAQRLCRIKVGQPVHVPWTALHEQFGQGYEGRLRKFREVFRGVVKNVLAIYKEARVEESSNGLILRDSPPPVAKNRLFIVAG
jgi:hypothetical protein